MAPNDWIPTLEHEPIDRAQAALYLGMTEDSFERLLREPWAGLATHAGPAGDLFFKPELDSLTDRYLPRFKTWSGKSARLREFFRDLEARTGFRVDPQPCEYEGCPRLADAVCANPGCRAEAPPRRVCVAHQERIRGHSDGILCAYCVRRALHGDLRARYQVAGTEQRLLRDYPG